LAKQRKRQRKSPKNFRSPKEGQQFYNEQMAGARSHPWVLAAHTVDATVFAPADSREIAARYILADFFSPKKEHRCVFEIVPMRWVDEVHGLPPVRLTPFGGPPGDWDDTSDGDDPTPHEGQVQDQPSVFSANEDGDPLTVGRLRQFLAERQDLPDSLPVIVGGADLDEPLRHRLGIADAIWADAGGGFGGRLVIGAMSLGLTTDDDD
jgi:hypothetical protein